MSDDHRKVCAFCEALGHEIEADGQVRAYTMDTYMGTPVGEDVPMKELGACAEHLRAIREVPADGD